MRRALASLLLSLLLPVTGAPQDATALPRADAVVKPRAYVSLAPVPRRHMFEIAVVAEILPGFHMNAHKPLDEFLIPTTLTSQLPHGLREVETIYPAGDLVKFSFSAERLLVYTGRVTLRMRLEAGADAPLGPQSLPLILRYQACNDTTCLPPVNIPLTIKFEIAAAGSAARSMHPDIFPPHQPKSWK